MSASFGALDGEEFFAIEGSPCQLTQDFVDIDIASVVSETTTTVTTTTVTTTTVTTNSSATNSSNKQYQRTETTIVTITFTLTVTNGYSNSSINVMDIIDTINIADKVRLTQGNIVCNFFVMNVASYCEVKPHLAFLFSSPTSWEWLAFDCSDEEPKAEWLALKFEHPEWAQ